LQRCGGKPHDRTTHTGGTHITRLLILVYLAAVVLANWSVSHYGPRAAVYNAFLLIGLDLVARDRLHDAWRGKWLWPRMAALIAAGSALSYFAFGADGRIAVASCVAFAIAATLDAILYHLAAASPWLERSNISNIGGAAADSIAFQTIAFGWSFPLIFAQFTAKVAGGLCWSLILKWWRT
jgi:uncharacterized PurR-regulated membrane protein YhhQ (DUF165 family)